MLSSSLSNSLISTANILATSGKGILAADESTNTMGKRLSSIPLPNTLAHRSNFRELIITTPNLGDYISGIILFEETLFSKTENDVPFVDIIRDHGIVVGIKVDKGVTPCPNALPDETITNGLDGLTERCKSYYLQGARFTKWRAVFTLSSAGEPPSTQAIKANCSALSQFALISQAQGLVPIVEPEILMSGTHDFDSSRRATEIVLSELYCEMNRVGVLLEGTLLKCSMCLRGYDYVHSTSSSSSSSIPTHSPSTGVMAFNQNKSLPQTPSTSSLVAHHTLLALSRSVPPAVPGVMFLSGGQSENTACGNLNAINFLARNISESIQPPISQPHPTTHGTHNINNKTPWILSFSYGRALQTSALKSWGGSVTDQGWERAQEILTGKAEACALASLGALYGDHPDPEGSEKDADAGDEITGRGRGSGGGVAGMNLGFDDAVVEEEGTNPFTIWGGLP